MGKKKFIDKKNSAHFHLVRRSQRDPLIADENSSQFVLIPAGRSQKIPVGLDYDTGKFHESPDGIEDLDEEQLRELEEALESGSEGNASHGEEEGEEGEEGEDGDKKQVQFKGKGKGKAKALGTVGEAAKYGIMFDDTEYDYTQHLKEMGAPGAVYIAAEPKKPSKNPFSIALPEEVLPSKYEEEVGMLNLAAPVTGPQPELGPDVLEVLEALDNEEFEGELDDDFLEELNKTPNSSEAEGQLSDEEYYSGEDALSHEGVYLPPKKLRDWRITDEDDHYETKSRFTNYSMTSSILSRTKELQLLDEKFDKLMEDYDDEEIGELEDGPEVHGMNNIENFESVLDEFLEEHAEITYKSALEQFGASTKEQILKSLEVLENSRPAPHKIHERPKKPAWDCESFLSTYSNLENHPGVIREKPKKLIVLDRTGMPKGFTMKPSEAASQAPAANTTEVPEKATAEKANEGEEGEGSDDESEDSSAESVTVGIARSKNETAEEKRQRKKAVKEQKRARRSEKKSNKTAFKTEQLRQERMKMQVAAQSPQVIHIN